MYNLRVDRINEKDKVCELIFDFDCDMLEVMYSILWQNRELWKDCSYILTYNNDGYECGDI